MAGGSDRAKLAQDLRFAAERPLRDFYRQAGGNDERQHPTLARIVKTIVGEQRWRARPNLSLLEVVQDAIATLPEQVATRAGYKNDPPVPTRGKPERDIAAILYGYKDNELASRYSEDGKEATERTYKDDYLPAAIRLAGLTHAAERTQGRLTGFIREDLADALLKLEKQTQAARDQAEAVRGFAGLPVVSSDRTPYIPRLGLSKELDGAMRTSQLVCLVGEAGTGKTRFVREHTAPTSPAWVDAAADETMVRDMVRLLERYNVDAASFDTARVRSAFGQLLERADGPLLVVLDGVQDPGMLKRLVPADTRSRVIATSQVRPPEGWMVVDVPDMEAEEAAALAATQLPGFTSSDYNALAAIFGCRPLLLEHGCTYIQHTGKTDIPAYCALVGKDMDRAIRAMPGKVDRRLTVIYQQYKKKLEREEPRSLELLELLAFVAHMNVPPEYAMSYMLNVPYITPDLLGEAQMEYQAAVQPLLDYSLVSSTRGYGTSMQPLTQHVLRSIFADRFPEIYQRAQPLLNFDGLHSFGQGLYDAGWHILTVTGRATCNLVLRTHARDRSLDLSQPSPTGVIGSVQWTVLVTELWKRFYLLMAEAWALGPGIHSNHSVGEAGTTKLWLTPRDILALADGLPPVQADEIQAVARDLFDILGDATTTRGLRSFQALVSSVLSPYQESYLGTLDFSVFFTIDHNLRELLESGPEISIASFIIDQDEHAQLAAMSSDEQRAWLDKKHAELANETEGMQE